MPEPNPYLNAAMGQVSSAFEFLCAKALTGPVENTFGTTDAGREFLHAAASAPDAEVRAMIPRMKKQWGAEFNIPNFRADLRDAKSQLARAAPGEFILSSSGVMKPCVANAITMLKGLPLRFNRFSQRVEVCGPLPWGDVAGTEWKNIQDTKAAEWCQHKDLIIPSVIAAEAVEAVANDHGYHPVMEYLDSLQWDGRTRLYKWLPTYTGCEETELTEEIGIRWMISAVARIYRPGCQCDYTLVLEGFQGTRKSSLLRALGEPWFTDDIRDIDKGHEAAIQLQGKWIVEFGELATFRKSKWEEVKRWLTLREDYFRSPYGRRAQTYLRQSVFSASTNRQQWLEDDTGGRRFWPIWCSKMDAGGMARDKDQLLAEAVHLYKRGDPWYLDDRMELEAAKEQSKRRVSDVWTSMVRTWCLRPRSRAEGVQVVSMTERVLIGEVLSECIGLPPGQWRQNEGLRVASILRGLGYSQVEDGVYGKD